MNQHRFTCSNCKVEFSTKFPYKGKNPYCGNCRVNNNNNNEPQKIEKQTFGVVINCCHGGACLSMEARNMYYFLGGTLSCDDVDDINLRKDPILVQVVDVLGKEANGASYSNLQVVQVPNEFSNCFKIDEYDGAESVEYDVGMRFLNDIKTMDLDAMTPQQCQVYLREMKNLEQKYGKDNE
ncbi:hypothetical protein Hokovirus_2_15 [Hokovirus HKV1]|uniref:Uncharacterized protein n=1 Tax=Hokovirus HKV1 TaxID=1977638 RepID=A0A1V0SFT5_9VIRU|nr:hypothetical protein Hokovirus_2_15 [Hokovirus HKV1]